MKNIFLKKLNKDDYSIFIKELIFKISKKFLFFHQQNEYLYPDWINGKNYF